MSNVEHIQNILANLEKHLNGNTENYIYRISMIQDLERVQKYGSTRIGLSDKLWDRNDELKTKPVLLSNVKKYKNFPLRHDDVIIGSYWDDLVDDSKLENSTFAHKLEIYENPFVTIYHAEYLLHLFKEQQRDSNNQGRHFLFLKEPLKALFDVVMISDLEEKK